MHREETKLSQYYSAYLWIMFVIVDRESGKLFHEEKPWKNLLAYFEYGNIADASTYQTLKENLVAKLCSSLSEILERPSDREILQRAGESGDGSGTGENGSWPVSWRRAKV